MALKVSNLFHDMRDKIKKYFWFTPEETWALITTTIVLAFMFSFDDWGVGKVPNPAIGFGNLLLAIVIVGVSLFIHESVHRIAGLQIGFRVEYKMWVPGLIIGLIITLLTNGKLWWIFAPGGIFLHHMSHIRLGEFRYGLNYWANAAVTIYGVVGTLVFIMILKATHLAVPNFFIWNMIVFNVALAVMSMLPIPPYDGSRILFQSIYWWFWMTLAAILVGLTALFTEINLFLILLGIIAVFLLITYIYHLLFERRGIDVH